MVEVKDKPTYPIGELAIDAFGRKPTYVTAVSAAAPSWPWAGPTWATWRACSPANRG